MTNDPHAQSDDSPELAFISRLASACLHINASLEPDTVLQEVVVEAQTLTAARCGVIITIGKDGSVMDFHSCGLTPDEHDRMKSWVDGPKLFEHPRDLEGPLGVDDMSAFVQALGFSAEVLPAKTFLGMPMLHRGKHVGNFYLAGKAGKRTFNKQDEKTLILFSAHAAVAIANARAYREERRARAYLETLVETSPVGVTVFDAAAARPVSFNREALRLLEGLREPGQRPEQLLKYITCRRGDGRVISFAECPLAEEFSRAETVRAEELVLSVPDGRRVKVLVNCTPITDDDGGVLSAVVTMQDLAGLEEMERMRAQFMGLVSHELRAPLMAIQGSAVSLRDTSESVTPGEVREYSRIIDEQAVQMRDLIGDLLDVGHIKAGTLSVRPEPLEVAELLDRARSTFLSGGSPHPVRMDLPPDLPWVMAERRRIVQVLSNLFYNAARHSPADSPIRVSATHDGRQVAVSVTDKGQGIAPERLGQLFDKHGENGDGLGGSLGLVICKGLVEAHGGRIRAESRGAGLGARFTFTLPVVGKKREDRSAEAANKAPEQAPVLVVDDDPQMLRHVRNALNAEGYRVVVTGEHSELGDVIRTQAPRLVLMDLMLPGTDGIRLMQTVPELSEVPVVFISAYGRDETVAKALKSGAADYIVKPFSATELVARAEAAMRGRAEAQPFQLGALTIDYARRRITLNGNEVKLTAREYELARALSFNAGRVMSYDSLRQQVWHGRASRPLVRTFIQRLRTKLADDANEPALIHTHRGVGYRMEPPDGA